MNKIPPPSPPGGAATLAGAHTGPQRPSGLLAEAMNMPVYGKTPDEEQRKETIPTTSPVPAVAPTPWQQVTHHKPAINKFASDIIEQLLTALTLLQLQPGFERISSGHLL